MAQTLYFWDSASYDDSLVSTFFHGLAGNSHFVIAEYLNSLEVTTTSPTNGSVQVGTGAAVMGGRLYTNSAAVSVAITSAVNNRVDRIVLRRNTTTQTIRVTKIIGVEGASPALPSLTTEDMPLAYVFVPAGYDPTTTPVAAANIHDQRSAYHVGSIAHKYCGEDIMPNGEFLAFSQGNLTTGYPEGWRSKTGAALTTCTSATLIGEQTRGRSVRVTANAGLGIATTVPIFNISTSETSYYTFKGQITITTGPAIVAVYGRVLGGAATLLASRNFYSLSTSPTTFEIRFPITSTNTYDALDIEVYSNTAAGDFYVGQLMLVDGWSAGNFRPKHEWIFFDQDVTDASWSSTAKSSGDTTLTYAGAFNANILPYCRGLLTRLRVRDSGGAGSPANLSLSAYNVGSSSNTFLLMCNGITNDYWREGQAYVALQSNDSTNLVVATVVASGASTADCTIQPIGIIT